MRKRIIDWIFTLQSQRGILGEKERRLYTYAYGLLLNKIAIYAIIAIVGTITGNWIGMFSFLLPFTILRQYAGGIHLEKPMNCIIFSGFLVFGCGQYLAVASDIGKILYALWVAAILLIFVLAPIDTKGKKLDKTAKKIYGRRARGVLVIEVMIAICFAIARAIIKDSPIIVLDEATAFSDPENEYLIQKAFEKLMQNKTVIIIAHRLSTIRNADKIIVMEKGQIVESGKHDDLVAAGGRYFQMWNHYTEAINWKLNGKAV